MFYWMQWSLVTGIGIGALFIVIGVLIVLAAKKPEKVTRGFYPIPTTRGDKLFLGVVSTLAFFMVWMAFFGEALHWLMAGIGAVWIVFQWIKG